MKEIVLSLAALLLVANSCARLPQMHPVGGPAASPHEVNCNLPFPQGKWEFVHYIEATLPGGKKGFVTGVTVISPMTGSIDCVIMTLEGFVLFNARSDQGLVVNRALAPFDKIEFAKGLMRDIRLIFLQPDGCFVGAGLLEDGFPTCRYETREGETIDIVTFSDGSWEIRRYGTTRRLTRTIRASHPVRAGCFAEGAIPSRLELKAYGLWGYELSMDLVSASRLSE
jgi:hypothetical protein